MVTRRRKRRSARRLRRVARRRNYWSNDAAGHRKAARLGWKRRKTSKRRKKNPFVSTRKRRVKARRRNMSYRTRRNPRYASYMPNPRRRAYRRRRRNPPLFKGLIPSQALIRSGLKLTVGIAAGVGTLPVSSKLMGMLKFDEKYAGAMQLVLGSLLVGMVRNRDVKDVGVVIAGIGLYDLISELINQPEWLPKLPKAGGLASLLPIEAPATVAPPQTQAASYGVALRPVSPQARIGVGASFEAPSMSTVGVAGDMEAFGHLPGIDYD